MPNNSKISEPALYKKLGQWFGSNWIVAIGLAAITYLVLSMALVSHTRTFFMNLDNVNQFYTWYQKLATSWHHGYLPVWNAGNYSGWPMAAEMQPGVFYPLNWLWVALFGSTTGISMLALNYLVAAHFWVAAFGAYLLIKQLGAKKWIAFVSSIIFAFSGMFALRAASQSAIFFALAYICYPLFFLLKYRDDDKSRLRWLVLAGVFLGMTLLIGHVGPFFYAFITIGLYEVVDYLNNFDKSKVLANAWPRIKELLIIGLVSCIVALPQLLVSAPYLSNSYRVQRAGYSGPGQKIGYTTFSQAFIVNLNDFVNILDNAVSRSTT